VFLLQQLLGKHASKLRYTYTAYPVINVTSRTCCGYP